jgi:hypothetical protein
MKQKNNEAEVREAIRLVWRNFPDGETTFSPCECGRDMGRGSGPCLLCARERLSKAVGDANQAEAYVSAVMSIRMLEQKMIDGIKPTDPLSRVKFTPLTKEQRQQLKEDDEAIFGKVKRIHELAVKKATHQASKEEEKELKSLTTPSLKQRLGSMFRLP